MATEGGSIDQVDVFLREEDEEDHVCNDEQSTYKSCMITNHKAETHLRILRDRQLKCNIIIGIIRDKTMEVMNLLMEI